jgi:hypothetical protein
MKNFKNYMVAVSIFVSGYQATAMDTTKKHKPSLLKKCESIVIHLDYRKYESLLLANTDNIPEMNPRDKYALIALYTRLASDNPEEYKKQRPVRESLIIDEDICLASRSAIWLLQQAVVQEDDFLIRKIFDHGLSANARHHLQYEERPVFFYAQNIKIIELFQEYHADLTAGTQLRPNVFWVVFANPDCKNKTALVAFYLKNSISPAQMKTNDYENRHNHINATLLHDIAFHSKKYDGGRDYIEATRLILQQIPNMVNIINNRGKTPLDEAYPYTAEDKEYRYQENKIFTDLLKSYGAKISDEVNEST